jgi:hypothetical protein
MSKMKCMVACALLVAATFWISTTCSAQSAFDGTWKIATSQAKLSAKPHVFYISEGWYHCTSCNPIVEIKADGSDKPVKGQAWDTSSVQVIDDHTFQLVHKKGGKVIMERTYTVSKDGKLLTIKRAYYPMNGSQPITTSESAKRVGVAPLGVHATSGSWQMLKIEQSANGLTFNLKVNGGEVTMTDLIGESYTAKLDGPDAPMKGSYNADAVSLKELSPDTIEETDKRGGTAAVVLKMTVHGKTMTIEETREPDNHTSTYVAHKQG